MVEEKGQASGRAEEQLCRAVGMLKKDLQKYYHCLGLVRPIGEGLGKSEGRPWPRESSTQFLRNRGHLRWTESRLSVA